MVARTLVTGGAGFIGSHVVDKLLALGHDVVVVDNFSTGSRRFLEHNVSNPALSVVELELLSDVDRLIEVAAGCHAIVHLAANADVRFGWDHTRRDLEQNVIVTHNVCEAARLANVHRLLFSSTGSVYGDTPVVPTPEDCPFPVQTSLYGASKSAAEAFIAAYAEADRFCATVFRFVSVIGPRYTHGHVVDFLKKLRADPNRLEILGDGNQRKSYMAVSDCVDAIVSRIDAATKFEVLNLGVDAYCTVRESASWICARLGLDPEFVFTGGRQGWIGDNPYIWLDISRAQALGWSPKFAIREGIEQTVDYLRDNEWVLDRPDGAST
ncbi:MAG: NAD-dependent epimerase/dehydratase family protein [Acidimicrobiales bacterium]